MEDIKKIKSRLETIQTVDPLINALRTISLGAWKTALIKREHIKKYRVQIERFEQFFTNNYHRQKKIRASEQEKKILVLLIGSDRGICGKYNASVINKFKQEFDNKEESITIGVLGKRLQSLLSNKGIQASLISDFPNSNCPGYHFALLKISQFQFNVFHQILIVYNHYLGSSKFSTRVENLNPQSIVNNYRVQKSPIGNEYIFDTNPKDIFRKLQELFIPITFYRCLIEATASEHSTRFNILEEASRNTSKIKNELIKKVQEHRRNRITKEIQDLSVAAGLLYKQ